MLGIFQCRQVKIILLEDLIRNPQAVYADLLQFLGLQPDSRQEFPPVNTRFRHRNRALARMLASPPEWLRKVARSAKRLLDIEAFGFVNRLNAMNRMDANKPSVNPQLRQVLIEAFRDDVGKLGKLIGRDLSHWLEVKPE